MNTWTIQTTMTKNKTFLGHWFCVRVVTIEGLNLE